MSEQGYLPRPLRSAIADHIGGGTPSRQVPSYWRGQIPWASVKDFSEQFGVIADTEEHISIAGLYASASNLIPAGTPLVCTRMAVGRAAMPVVPMAINQDVKAIFPASGVSAAYLLKLLQFIQPKAEAQAVGSTVKGIRVQDYLDIEVPIADTDAQPVIAHVLDTLGTAIQETEVIIAKINAVKQGLLHDLLMRGIDANGELRPPQAEAPHLYKPTPLGWIPNQWEFGPASRWCERPTVGVVNSATHAYVSEGVPFIRSQNVRPNRIVLDDVLYVTQRFNRDQSKSILRAGDVVIVRTGYPGTAAVVPPNLDGSNCFSLVVATPKRSLSASFLTQYMNSPIGMRQVGRLQFGSAQHNFNVGEMRDLPVPLPSPVEQAAIIASITGADVRLASEEGWLLKLQSMASGLTGDLLTGRILVTPLLAEADHQGGAA
jgi:type I restriction enzyme S subunit